MKNMSLFVLLFAVLALSVACGGKKVVPDSSSFVSKPGVASLSVGWLKDKKSKFDLKLNIRNENPNAGMIIYLADIGCRRGAVSGTLKHTFFNTGERTMDFKPNEAKSFNLVCNLGMASTGDFAITIAKIHDNPSMDGKTPGKVIAENVVWKLGSQN